MHHDLLPLDEVNLGADGIVARIEPYYSQVESGAVTTFRVTLSNPFPDEQVAVLRLITPVGWRSVPDIAEIRLPALGPLTVELEAVVGGPAARRSRVAVDVSIGDLKLGQHAEALVDVIEPASKG